MTFTESATTFIAIALLLLSSSNEMLLLLLEDDGVLFEYMSKLNASQHSFPFSTSSSKSFSLSDDNLTEETPVRASR